MNLARLGVAVIHYDKAIRGRAVEELSDLQSMFMIGVYDKTGKLTDQVAWAPI